MLGCKIYKLKKDKVSEWREWCAKLNSSLQEEALQTLKEEGNSLEAFLIFEIGGEFYTIGLGIGEFLPVNKDQEINTMHINKKKECFEKAIPTENLYLLHLAEKTKN
jgi:hypothetical protein